MLVNYKKPNLLGVPYEGGLLQIKPGVNNIPDKIWKKVAENPTIKQKMGAGYLKIAAEAPEKPKSKVSDESQLDLDGEGEEGNVSLSDMNATEATELINETFDEDLLLEWKKDETRKGVLKVLDEQIELVELGEDGEEEDGDEDEEEA